MEESLRVLVDLLEPGEHVYLVGGCVRDLILGRPTQDLDLVTDGDPARLAERIARRINGTPFCLNREWRTYRVVPSAGCHGLCVDVSPLHHTLEANLLRRDFTINAMALPLHKDAPLSLTEVNLHVVDPAHGLDDLKARCVRHVHPNVFVDDPIRLLRAVRLAVVLGFTLARETESLVRRHAPLLASAATERVRDELFLLLKAPDPARSVRLLDQVGLLGFILPELLSLKDLQQNANRHLDAWEHTLETIRQCECLLSGDDLPPDVADPVQRVLSQPISPPRTRQTLLLLAALLHDVAKPRTRRETPHGRPTFWGHDVEGAGMAMVICRRLRLSGRESKAISRMIRSHLQPGWLSHEESLDARKTYRFFLGAGEAAVETLLLSLADRMALRGPGADRQRIERHRQVVIEMLRLYFSGAPVAHPILPVDGQTLMDATGLEPGPLLGALLEALREAVAVGEVKGREEALAFAKRWVAQHKPER